MPVPNKFDKFLTRSVKWAEFENLTKDDANVKQKVINRYIDIKSNKVLDKHAASVYKTNLTAIKVGSLSNEQLADVTNVVWVNTDKKDLTNLILRGNNETVTKALQDKTGLKNITASDATPILPNSTPFDRRLDRTELSYRAGENEQSSIEGFAITPFDSKMADVASIGHVMSLTALKNLPDSPNKKAWEDAREVQFKQIQKDDFYKGVPALQNAYALVNLYGSKAGKLLVNQKGQRKWYEVDNDNEYNFASTPTTSSLIGWGNGDPYGRTPYFFTDFVFSKYWKKIENNRLITLRRYPAPVYDNLKFPGMTGSVNIGSSQGEGTDGGSTMGESSFPPMASAITYFGGDTGNNLNSLLKFMTGYEWGEVQASIWEVTTDNVPDNKSGLGQLFGGGVGSLAEMLNVASGNFSYEYIAAGGNLPPDPYVDGPYENRIQGPVNRIDKVMKRNPGLKFQMDNLKLVFEYAARPVGGINPKAVLLDIMSNFLVMGSASAVFFGGAHRFMINPAKYPFIGGEKSIEKLYKGDPIGYSFDAIQSFAGEGAGSVKGAGTNIMESLKAFWNQLFSGEKGSFFGSLTSLLDGGVGNLVKNEIAKKSAGQIPYLKGMRSILTGEPVGEWHITVGNPLNPIAMIGNLICDNIEVEFNDELGPDDFPTEIKITVNLKHGMGRDKDAIESIFNRGMGRIYNLPDSFLGSGDYQTSIDGATQEERLKVGLVTGGKDSIIYQRGQDSRTVSPRDIKGTDNKMHGGPSIWDRATFKVGLSENSDVTRQSSDLLKSAYRAADWVAQKALV